MQKYDSFSPRRATNIDGFFARSTGDKPRQPVFRDEKSQPKTPVTAAKPQVTPDMLVDMPKRDQPILASAAEARPENAITGFETDAPKASKKQPVVEEPRQRGRLRSDKPQKPEKLKKPRKKWRIITRWVVWSLVAIIVIIGGWFGWRLYRDAANITGNNNPFSLLQVFHPVPLKNQDGRVNILLAANSADDPGHDGANLTDSIMVLSVDTKNNTALMLSIPRDLWVYLPDGGYHSKINAAYPDGGMDELQQVIEDNLNVPIDYQALISYDAFRDMVDAVGGITININSDDPRGIYDPSLDYTSRTCCALAKYPNGPVTLNGKQALNLARARGDAYGSYGYMQSDFTRTMYQRLMLTAVKDKAVQSSVIANPFKVANLVDAIGNNVKTNLQLNEIETLYTYMKKIDDNAIASYNINTLKGDDTTMLMNYTAPTTPPQSALAPAAGVDDFTDIQAQLQKLLSGNVVAIENASVVVLNATGVTGLANTQANALLAKGMQVMADTAPADQAKTTIIDNSGGKKPQTLAYLKKKYNATIATNTSLTAQYPSADFILLIGQDNAPKTTGQ